MRIFRFTFAYIFFAFTIIFISDKALSEQDDFSVRLRKIENDIENSRMELEKGEKKLEKLKSREKKILSELNLQEKNIENVHKNLRIIQNEEKSLRQDSQAAQKSYDDAMKIFTSRSEIYAERLCSMYKRQKVSPVEILFTSGSMSSVLRGFKMLSALAVVDLEVLNDLRQQTNTIQVSLNKLKAALNANMSLVKSKKNEQLSLAKSRDTKSKLLDEIKRDEELQIVANSIHEENYKHSQAQLDKIIRDREKERKRAKIKVPPTLEGYDFAEHKGKLPWPVNGKVVSRFGNVIDSSTKTQTNNRGIEIETKHGEPVSAIGDGVVFMIQYFRGYGNFVLISHPSHPQDYYTIYGHLSDILVNNGDIVAAGDVIGLAGSTGMIDSDSPQLVLEVLKGEKPENPLNWLSPERQRAGK